METLVRSTEQKIPTVLPPDESRAFFDRKPVVLPGSLAIGFLPDGMQESIATSQTLQRDGRSATWFS